MEVSTDGGTTWNTAKGASQWSYSWTPPQDGSYTIMTRATDKAGNVEMPGTGINVTANVPVTVNDLAPSLPAAVPGQAVTWTAAAAGGSGNYKYQFLRKGPDTAGAYALVQDWGNSNNWNWDIGSSSVGTNSILVNVMDSSITTAAAGISTNSKGKGSKSKTYTVGAASAITISSITPSVSSAVAGNTVTWTASATGGSGTYQYQFMRTGPDTGGTAVVAKAYGTSNTWSWTTTSAMAGSNTISVYVKNSDGTGEVSSTAPAYTVSPATVPAIVVNSLAPSVASPETVGTSVTWTASATGGTRHIPVPVLTHRPGYRRDGRGGAGMGDGKDMDLDSHQRNGRERHDNGRSEEFRRHGPGHKHGPGLYRKSGHSSGYCGKLVGTISCKPCDGWRIRHLDGVSHGRERHIPVPVLQDGP